MSEAPTSNNNNNNNNNNNSLAERLRELLHQRTLHTKLPPAHMRCPINPSHQIPIAIIVTHLIKTHSQDILSYCSDAMYASGTYERRRAFLQSQLRICKKDNDNERRRNRNRSKSRNNNKRRRRGSRSRSRSDSMSSNNSSESYYYYYNRNNKHNKKNRTRYSKNSSESYSSESSEDSLPRLPPTQPVQQEQEENNNIIMNNNYMKYQVGPEVIPPQINNSNSYNNNINHNNNFLLSPVGYGSVGIGPQIPITPLTTNISNNINNCNTNTLMGRYTLGQTIRRQSLMDYLFQFGPLQHCDIQPQHGTIIIIYQTIEAASHCCLVSCPFFVIDGVTIEMWPVSNNNNNNIIIPTSNSIIPTVSSMNYVRNGTSYNIPSISSTITPPPPILSLPPPPPPPLLSINSSINNSFINPLNSTLSSLEPQYSEQKSNLIITVPEKTVEISSNNAKNISTRNSNIEAPKDIFIANIKKEKKDNIEEKDIWEEFQQFGIVKNIILVGSRVIIEYESTKSVEDVTRALEEGTKLITCCSLLK